MKKYSKENYPIIPEEWGSGEVKWTETVTEDGWHLVENEGGATLGYSPDSGIKLIQVDGYAFKDLNQDGVLNLYEDWRQDPDSRAADLAAKLTGEEIAGLMIHPTVTTVSADGEEIKALLDDGMRTTLQNALKSSTEVQAKWNNSIQAYVEGKNHGIPVSLSTNPRTESGWPDNLALAGTFNPDMVKEISNNFSKEYRALGINTLLGPQIDLASDPRWIRATGTFGGDPALLRDMAKASVEGHQSTFDEAGNDLGWGKESVNTMIKHWPSDGAGEGGRESHDPYGKYNVYPGGQFETGTIAFVDGGLKPDSKTGSVAAVMTSYSIAWSDDESLGELVGSAFSKFKMDLLRSYGFDGLICTDWTVTNIVDFFGKPYSTGWGVEDLSEVERCYLTISVGADQIGGLDKVENVIGAYHMAVEKDGEAAALTRFREAARKINKTAFQAGTFENPYINVAAAVDLIDGTKEKTGSFEAQLKTVVMVKNNGQAIAEACDEERPTVYVPLVYTPITPASFFTPVPIPAHADLPVALEVLEQYFKVITDTVSDQPTGPPDGNGNPTLAYQDIIRATPEELAECDYAAVFAKSPANIVSGVLSGGQDPKTKEFIPISLQYGPYTADSDSVRRVSVAGDRNEAGEKENDSYYGKEAQITNATDLDMILYAADNMPQDGKVIVALNCSTPMIVGEFEDKVDAILIGYRISNEAFLEIISGKVEPNALLPMQIPKDMETVEAQNEDVPRDMDCHVDTNGNHYDFAFGLNWNGVINDERVRKYNVAPLVSPEARPVK